MTVKCTACGSTNVQRATIEGAALSLDSSPTLKKVFNVGGQISTEVCLDCGVLGPLRGDPKKLAKMLK